VDFGIVILLLGFIALVFFMRQASGG